MIVSEIREKLNQALKELYPDVSDEKLTLLNTKKEFSGDYTVVLFPISKRKGLPPEVPGKALGEYMVKNFPDLISAYQIIKGYLNLTVADTRWIRFAEDYQNGKISVPAPVASKKIIVEYSSPNTNKPLHLGHLRNIFLGWSLSEILKETGHKVIKTCVVNDRGIHICKSMLGWKKFANGATPQSAGIKGDHFVGDYYVKFSEELKKQKEELIQSGLSPEQAEKEAPIMKEARQMLVDWENGDAEVLALWKQMNNWVYEGFNLTYQRIGADFEKIYYESDTYLLGKNIVEEGLKKGVFYKKPDGSVWIDLTSEGLDEKLVLRKDGTSVYITQDLGLAQLKYDDFTYDESIYVVGDEQNYHFKALKFIMQKLGKAYADSIFHLSYGMVELPTGRMKSREGTVVDADDLIEEMIHVAKTKTEELGKVKDFSEKEREELYHTLALGALKFFLLRVDPKKKMIFHPEESIDFHGFTGPFIQYTHARIRSILRKAGQILPTPLTSPLPEAEKELIKQAEQFPLIVAQAAQEFNPSVIAVYAYHLARQYNSFYADYSVLNAETEEKKRLRLMISAITAGVISSSLRLLGIKAPERM
ncbi:MAG: arginine--tRNA ligase [Chitinophagaceae bacterium]|nr:arginine--tRNA ligase [Chitinophagaceae bacterium]